jgi:hypothetical protein
MICQKEDWCRGGKKSESFFLSRKFVPAKRDKERGKKGKIGEK